MRINKRLRHSKQIKLLSLMAIPLVLVGCSKPSPSKNADSAKDKSAKIVKKSKSSKINKNHKQAKNKKLALWNDKKNKQLENFMQEFSQTMDQDYRSYNPENNVSFFGIDFPDFFAEDKIKVNENHVSVAWSDNGEKTADYSVVAVYSDANPDKFSMVSHLYLFTIKDGQPVVLITQQNQGMPDEMIHFEVTKNESLSSNFNRIVTNNSKIKATPTTTPKETPANNSSKNAAGIVPQNLIGTWYSYSEDLGLSKTIFESNRVSYDGITFSEIHTEDEYLPGEEAIENENPAHQKWLIGRITNVRNANWLNVKGWYQTAGGGGYFKVVNREINGKTIPVVSVANGAGIWVNTHCYPTAELAREMADTQFDDEE